MKKRQYKGHKIERSWCKGCGICVAFCPKQVLELDLEAKVTVVRPEDCICCKMCEFRCPDLAIYVMCGDSGMEDGHD
jgi:2-oxoglutarate ferredoxin oxidoreductase subunit delta